MANQRTITGLAMVLLAGLTLIAAGCGSDDGLGPNEGRVRFVLSSDAAGAMGAGDATVSTLPELQSGVEGTTVEPTLHGDDDDGDRTGWIQSANVTFSSRVFVVASVLKALPSGCRSSPTIWMSGRFFVSISRAAFDTACPNE